MTQRPRIYLDHAATTPIRPEAKAAMIEGMERWANPSSPHTEGRAARAALEDARERIKRALGWVGELIFTSGATEAIEIAMRRTKAGRRFISAFEHDAVFRADPSATILPCGDHRDMENWKIDDDHLDQALLTGGRSLIALQSVNSETGTSQLKMLEWLAPKIRHAGGIVLSDCSQSAGWAPLPDADLVVVSAHKLGGPPGVGALLVRDPALLEASGGQERGYRGGTENLPAIIGFAAALESIARSEDGFALWPDEIAAEIGSLLEQLEGAGAHRIQPGPFEAPHILSIAAPSVSARVQLVQFDLAGIAVSAGSACSSGSLTPSRTLKAFAVPDDVAERTIRVSFGWTSTNADIAAFADAWWQMLVRSQARAQ